MAHVDLSVRIVRYFVAIVDAGTYTSAAERLHVATPSLSQQIRKLERDLGVTLIDRDHRGVRLTPAGTEFLPVAIELLAVHDRAVAVARRRRRASRNQLRIGFFATVAGDRTRTILDRLKEAAPDADIQLVQIGWGEQSEAVLEGRVDVAFARPPLAATDLREIPVLEEPRVLAMSAQNLLASKRVIHPGDLADVVQVNTDIAPEMWRNWWSIDPRPDGSRARYGPVVHGTEEMLEVVATSEAVAITAESVVGAFPRADVAYRPIVDVEPAKLVLLAPLVSQPLIDELIEIVTHLS